MIASLYQRVGSGASAGAASAMVAGSAAKQSLSFEINEVVFVANAPQDAEKMRGNLSRIEHHEVAGPMPCVAGVVQQVVHLERLVGLQPECHEIERHPPRLRMVGIEV